VRNIEALHAIAYKASARLFSDIHGNFTANVNILLA